MSVPRATTLPLSRPLPRRMRTTISSLHQALSDLAGLRRNSWYVLESADDSTPLNRQTNITGPSHSAVRATGERKERRHLHFQELRRDVAFRDDHRRRPGYLPTSDGRGTRRRGAARQHKPGGRAVVDFTVGCAGFDKLMDGACRHVLCRMKYACQVEVVPCEVLCRGN